MTTCGNGRVELRTLAAAVAVENSFALPADEILKAEKYLFILCPFQSDIYKVR